MRSVSMHKLRLTVDDLRVESFDTTRAPEEKGTVFGVQATYWGEASCYDPTCVGFNTCTCGESCPATCLPELTCGVNYTCRPRQCGGATYGGECTIEP
jgi:hypothetical protein